MLKKDLVLRSPVEKTIGADAILEGGFGAVLSRAGIGKTSFLVQIALTRLLKNEKVLHISLDDTMEKINVRYDEGYNNLVDSIGYVDAQKAAQVQEEIMPNRVGISYTEATFDTEKIEDYLNSFKTADLDLPRLMIIDGLDFDGEIEAILAKFKAIQDKFSIAIWFAVKTHREEALCEDGFPVQLEKHKDLFGKALMLKTVDTKIEAVALTDTACQSHLLNPATMMWIDPEE